MSHIFLSLLLFISPNLLYLSARVTLRVECKNKFKAHLDALTELSMLVVFFSTHSYFSDLRVLLANC